MSYHPTETIFDLLAASGSMPYGECFRECATQSVPFPTTVREGRPIVIAALTALESAGIVEFDEAGDYWEFTEYGYALCEDWNLNGAERYTSAYEAEMERRAGC